jgi:methylated-DNA-protein-cysteine methyltransferase-like protein
MKNARPAAKQPQPKGGSTQLRAPNKLGAIPVPFAFARPPAAGEVRQRRIEETIRSIPRGKVASYGQVAAAAGYPGLHRLVAKILKGSGHLGPASALPWHRVLGSGGEIKVPEEYALEQRNRLLAEGVSFLGRRVDLAKHEHSFE